MNEKIKKAVGYLCDVSLPGTDIVISKYDQLARIRKYAEKEGIELVAVFEDEEYTHDVMERPGLKKMLAANLDYETVLVERVWVFCRKIKNIEKVMEAIEANGCRLVATSYLWDCASQQVRHRYADCDEIKYREAV